MAFKTIKVLGTSVEIDVNRDGEFYGGFGIESFKADTLAALVVQIRTAARKYRRTVAVHTSADTAYLVNDYPYGFRLRCKIRYWVETNPKHGMRFMSQTTNPKKAGDVWNKPKASTY